MIETPVTVIAGPKACGKTTLGVALVKANPGLRVAALVNRLDQSMADADALSAAGARVLPVPGGCMCCALYDSFVAAMLQITAVRDGLDHILIEAAAPADPTPLIEFTQADPELSTARLLLPHAPDAPPAPDLAGMSDAIIPWGAKFDKSFA